MTRILDCVLIAGAAALWLITVILQTNEPGAVPVWVLYADWVPGLLGCVALWWRRRFPVVLGVALAVSSSFSETIAGAAIVALFTVAVHRSARATAAVCATSLAALSMYQLLWPVTGVPPVTVFVIIGLGHVAVVVWGLSVRSRRALVTSLRERAAAAEVEARLRSERSEHEAREALAREMHDVLADRSNAWQEPSAENDLYGTPHQQDDRGRHHPATFPPEYQCGDSTNARDRWGYHANYHK